MSHYFSLRIVGCPDAYGPPRKRLSKPSIDAVGDGVLAERRQLLAALWDDCDDELRADLGMLCEGELPLTGLSDRRRDALVERGFGQVSGNRLRSFCRLMQRYAVAQAPAVADLTRLFGTTSGFDAHVRSLLALRLAQVAAKGVDDDLRDYVSNAIRELAPAPNARSSGQEHRKSGAEN